MYNMKPLLIVANFKSHQTMAEAKLWLENFKKLYEEVKNPDKKIVLCPSFTLLETFKNYVTENKLEVELGAQNISRFPQGAYTGEVNGAQIKDFANYVLIGHSERRGAFGEDESFIEEKIKISKDYNLKPILFIQNETTPISKDVDIIVYEPPSSISTVSGGIPDSPTDVSSVVNRVREEHELKFVLYGGSVDSKNVSTFTNLPKIDGVVPGRASLDPVEFARLIENV